MVRKILLALIILFSGVGFTACTPKSHVVKVVKPRKHWFPYNHKKHHKRKRTKTVRMKS